MLSYERFQPGNGGDCILISGEKTALWDTGMFYCADEGIELTKKALNGRRLDYIILSHTHYDHIGALSSFRNAFDGVQVIASEYAAYVFTRDGAKKLMKEMSENAARVYMGDASLMKPFDVSGFYVDIVLHDGEYIDLGTGKLLFMNTPGHTKCSISLWDAETGTFIASESLGVFNRLEYCHLPALTSLENCFSNIDRAKVLPIKNLYLQHTGLLTQMSPAEFFEQVLHDASYFKSLTLNCINNKGMSDKATVEYLLKNIHDVYIIDDRQPSKAFYINTEAYIKLLRRDHPEYFK